MDTKQQEYLKNRREVLIENVVFEGFDKPEIDIDEFYKMLNAVIEETKKQAKEDPVIKIGISENEPFNDTPTFVVYSTRWETEDEYSERINKTDLKKLKKKDRDSIERMKNLIDKYPDFAIMITDDLKRKKSHGTIF